MHTTTFPSLFPRLRLLSFKADEDVSAVSSCKSPFHKIVRWGAKLITQTQSYMETLLSLSHNQFADSKNENVAWNSSLLIVILYAMFLEPLLVLIEYVPYGDLLGYLRKSRGLNDTYYKDPDIKPKTSLTSQQLMKFAWQIADGMSYLSLRKVSLRVRDGTSSIAYKK